MTRLALTISVLAGALAGAADCSAELVNSVMAIVRRGLSHLQFTSIMLQPGTTARIRDSMDYNHQVFAGAGLFALTVDTTTDRASVPGGLVG